MLDATPTTRRHAALSGKRFLLRWYQGSGNHGSGPIATATIRVDACDAHYLRSSSWRISQGYVRASGSSQLLSHLILGVEPGVRVTYLDGNPLNLTRKNLIAMT